MQSPCILHEEHAITSAGVAGGARGPSPRPATRRHAVPGPCALPRPAPRPALHHAPCSTAPRAAPLRRAPRPVPTCRARARSWCRSLSLLLWMSVLVHTLSEHINSASAIGASAIGAASRLHPASTFCEQSRSLYMPPRRALCGNTRWHRCGGRLSDGGRLGARPRVRVQRAPVTRPREAGSEQLCASR